MLGRPAHDAAKMSFLRHGEIYRWGRETAQTVSPAHPIDESPTGYFLAGCSPAVPDSASPAEAMVKQRPSPRHHEKQLRKRRVPLVRTGVRGLKMAFPNAFTRGATEPRPGYKSFGGLPPDFLFRLVASAHFMRFSLKKTAHAVVSSAAYRKSGSPHRFRPRYAGANLGHPSHFLERSGGVQLLRIEVRCLEDGRCAFFPMFAK
jgi:hypothetical protein